MDRSSVTINTAGSVQAPTEAVETSSVPMKFRESSKAIGQLLHQVRTQRGISVTKCAALIGTSRRRYSSIEQGNALIYVVELALLADFLHIPLPKLENIQGFADAGSLGWGEAYRVRRSQGVDVISAVGKASGAGIESVVAPLAKLYMMLDIARQNGERIQVLFEDGSSYRIDFAHMTDKVNNPED
jgi:transcriptional regulator with XRE-family HTH domain